MPGQAGSSTNAGRYWIWIRSVSCLFILSSPVVVTVSSSPPPLPTHGEMAHQRALGRALQAESCVLYLPLPSLPCSDEALSVPKPAGGRSCFLPSRFLNFLINNNP